MILYTSLAIDNQFNLIDNYMTIHYIDNQI